MTKSKKNEPEELNLEEYFSLELPSGHKVSLTSRILPVTELANLGMEVLEISKKNPKETNKGSYLG